MNYEITPPSPGEVTLHLTFDEAEIVARAVGLITRGSLTSHSPNLVDFVEDMVEIVGRSNSKEARKYLVLTGSFSQNYIIERGDEGFEQA
jgi:hypothetical protein